MFAKVLKIIIINVNPLISYTTWIYEVLTNNVLFFYLFINKLISGNILFGNDETQFLHKAEHCDLLS